MLKKEMERWDGSRYDAELIDDAIAMKRRENKMCKRGWVGLRAQCIDTTSPEKNYHLHDPRG